jgi:hypothetical protein
VRSARIFAVLVGVCWLAASCTNLSPSKERASDVYATIIRSFATQPKGEPSLKVYVEPRGEGSAISVDVQADVVTAVEDVADVRFIDARSEALQENEAAETVVRDGGILLAFGPVPNDATDVVVEVDQYIDETNLATHRFVMHRKGDEWIIDDTSVTYETITPDEP